MPLRKHEVGEGRKRFCRGTFLKRYPLKEGEFSTVYGCRPTRTSREGAGYNIDDILIGIKMLG